MIKRLVPYCIFLILLLTGGAPAQSAPAQSAPDRISLNGEWRFSLASSAGDADRLSGFYEPAFDSKDFRPIPVPSNWALQGFEEPIYNTPTDTQGFYLKTFKLPAQAENRRVLLHFDGVWDSAEVWINGRAAGRHDSGFTSFAFEITHLLKPSEENTLAVRVRQMLRDSALDSNDDWALGGIYRDVWIEMMPRDLYIDRVTAATRFDEQYRDADLRTKVFIASRTGDHSSRGPSFEVRATLTGPDGREVQRSQFTGSVAGGFNGREIPLDMHVHEPLQWTAETPVLYGLKVELVKDGRVIHSREDRIGFREVSTSGGVLRINGKPVKLRGVCRHDLNPDTGRATRREHWLQDIRMMKAANINAVRTSHYPPAEGFLRLCDEMGLYVIDEVPMGYGGESLNDPSFAASVLLRAHETVTRDINRPSVIIWSIGNEDPLTALHLSVIRQVKGYDPTRPVLMPWRAEEDLPPEIDILAPHYYTAAQYDELAARAGRPVITTEYTHALGAEDFGGLQDRWQALIRHPAGAGGMIWHWQDQGIRRPVNGRTVLDPLKDLGRYRGRSSDLVRHSDIGNGEIYDSHGVFGTDGIVDPDRRPQRDYWETKAVYAPVTVLVDRTPFTPGQSFARIPVRNDFDFTDLSRIGIRWKLMAGERQVATGDLSQSLAPHAAGSLDVPVNALTELEPGDAYYIHITFRRPDGSEITTRSVRLTTPEVPAATEARHRTQNRFQLSKRGPTVTVTAGQMQYEFDPKTGSIASATFAGRQLITGSGPAVWRPLTISETNLRRGWEKGRTTPPDYSTCTTTVSRWEVAESRSEIRITAEADHRFDEKNNLHATYTYTVTPDGALKVAYSFKPQIELNWLPEAGLALDTAPELSVVRWLGLGPVDSYPNKQAAAIFGQWRGRAGTDALHGIKSGVEWIELSSDSGIGLRFNGSSFARLEGGDLKPGRLKLLSSIVGRSTKFKIPEKPEWQMNVSPSTVLSGGFSVSPVRTAAGRE